MTQQDRREFLSATLLAGLSPALRPTDFDIRELASLVQTPPQEVEIDGDTADFWTRRVRQASWQLDLKSPDFKPVGKSKKTIGLLNNAKAQIEALSPPPPPPPLPGEDTNPVILDAQLAPEFFVFSEDKGFRRARDIKPDELLEKGDVKVSLRVVGFRPSQADRSSLGNIIGGYLRVDLQQLIAPPSLAEALAWTALATFVPNAQTLPSTANFDFAPQGTVWGKLHSVILTKGFGSWTWNFSIQQKESFWHKLAGLIYKFRSPLATGVLASFGLPSIALSALGTFDNLYGKSLATGGKTLHLFQSQDKSIIATRSALTDSILPGAPDLFLRDTRRSPTYYVIVARKHADAFAAAMADHKVAGGFVINKNATDEVKAAERAIPDVSYLLVSVSALPAPSE